MSEGGKRDMSLFRENLCMVGDWRVGFGPDFFTAWLMAFSVTYLFILFSFFPLTYKTLIMDI